MMDFIVVCSFIIFNLKIESCLKFNGWILIIIDFRIFIYYYIYMYVEKIDVFKFAGQINK